MNSLASNRCRHAFANPWRSIYALIAARSWKTDLSLLVTLEQARRHALACAAQAIAAGDGERALRHAETAHRLREDRESWRWLALAYLLMRDFGRALAARSKSVSN